MFALAYICHVLENISALSSSFVKEKKKIIKGAPLTSNDIQNKY
jgi:hypothetical protein